MAYSAAQFDVADGGGSSLAGCGQEGLVQVGELAGEGTGPACQALNVNDRDHLLH